MYYVGARCGMCRGARLLCVCVYIYINIYICMCRGARLGRRQSLRRISSISSCAGIRALARRRQRVVKALADQQRV